MFQVAEPTREITYRLRPTDRFQSTGFTQQVDPRTNQPIPQMMVAIPELAETARIEVQYVDVRDQLRGPYSLLLDRGRAVIHDAQRKLDLTRGSWVRWGGPGHPDRLYFTHLAAYREAIAEVRYAVDSGVPTQPFQLPDLSVGSAERLYVKVRAGARWAVVQITFRDVTRSEIVRSERPIVRSGTARR
jgi:hypothetical protein